MVLKQVLNYIMNPSRIFRMQSNLSLFHPLSKWEVNASNSRKIAILIDDDNAECSLTSEFIAETSRYGIVTVKRIYGDWTSPQM